MSEARHIGAREQLVLGIETSCDETAAAVVARSSDGKGRILSGIVRSQIAEHRAFGGVVPEIAARAHVDILDVLVREAMVEAGTKWPDLSAVAATGGPGLIGGLIVGMTTGKVIATVHHLPFLSINHLEAHALTVGLTEDLRPPYLLLLISGGHTQIVAVEAVGRYRRLGSTVDDALGEAFDKTAKLLGLGFPGGPEVEKAALSGNPARYQLPRPMLGRSEPLFSFAGLKTAIRRLAADLAPLTQKDVVDLCASFERAIADTVSDRVAHAILVYLQSEELAAHPHLVVAGGVAANKRLRAALLATATAHGFTLHIPPAELCTDNAAMIAWAGAEKLARGERDPLSVPARARWPLDEHSTPLVGKGRLGAKV
ncbi:MAG: tRNA (adenosine(37)-N6)-threonylcarbamoyltransferase complex transferase subunit TsaD [Hyphomicrobiaceae bacterium]|nr:MAG: tRNA (adenosine(37)-N6)-threonylcarbamoyltransferase complex transferase subunit TsaD [Hyphomicrobiaceae bacterium]